MPKPTKKTPARKGRTQKEKPEYDVAAERYKLAESIHEILINPETPVELFDLMGEFINDAACGPVKLYWQPRALQYLLDFVEMKAAHEAKEVANEASK